MIVFIIASLIGLVVFANHSKQKARQETKKQPASSFVEIEWKERPLHEEYPPGTTTNDIVRHTLDRMEQLHTFLSHEIRSDANLTRLLAKERSVALTPDQLDADLKKLNGMEIGFIGQLHESPDSSKHDIKSIQSEIAKMVREQYEVLWTEDFTGGSIITAENGWEELVAESAESDIPSMRNLNNEAETKAYMRRSTPQHASFQFLFDPKSTIEVRGVDYRPVKAIQQHFMEYKLPEHIRGPIPFRFTPMQEDLIMRTLSDVRDLYILRTIALNADRSKRNVLVLGAYHLNHIAYVMARYGAKSTLVFPKEKEQ